ncbi:MAG TPA: retroviral-like aspartic protease family protein [Sphingomicrobium sp.]|jgi:predicted aspartyl protease
MMRFVALLILVGSAPAFSQPFMAKVDTAAGIPKVDETTQTEDVHFKNEADDRMTVPVKLSGAGPFRFLVDTGADHTAISRELAGRLGLVKSDSASLHTISGVSTVSTTNVPALQLTRKPVRVTDAPVLESAYMGADGILGVDSLQSQRVEFNFDTQTLSVVPSAVRQIEDEPGAIVVSAARKQGRLVVTDASANGHRLTVVIDTGAELSMGNEALRKELTGRGLLDPSEKVQLQSVTGAMVSGDYMFVRKLEIGGVVIQNLAIVFADAHTFKKLKLERQPALLLGMNAIRAFKKVSIDFASRKFRVVLPESSRLDVRLASTRL